MGQIGEWLQPIVAAIILAGFLEMLLPDNELKDVTKMIMGLLIIMLLIQPLVKLFHFPDYMNWSFPALVQKEGQPSTAEILKQGQKLRQNWSTQFNKENKQLLERKIHNILGLIDDIKLENLALNYTDAGLFKAVLKVRPAGDGLSIDSKEKAAAKIIDSVRLMTDLAANQIEVIWNDGKKPGI